MNALKSLLLLVGLSAVAHADAPATQPVNERKPIGERLLRALDAPPAGVSDRSIIAEAAKALPEDSRLRARIVEASTGEIDRDALREIAADLIFSPLIEAPTPEGWPAFTPVGEVQLKSYPKYRMAYIDRGDTLKGGEFFTLFFHIQRNQIAMTGPVEMEMTGDKRPEMKRMAFLYQNTDIGSLGKDRKVTVVDVDPMLAVSVGVRGNYSGATMREARDRIDQWLEANPDYKSAGELRVMGYNSPQVPPDERYAEIQLPVARR